MRHAMAGSARQGLAVVAAAGLLAGLAGCTALGSREPLFAADAYERLEIDEPAAFQAFDAQLRLIVIPKGDGRFGLAMYGRRDEDAGGGLLQDMYAEGGVIALGGGTYALQAECVRGWKDGEILPIFAPLDGETFEAWTYYMLAKESGIAGTYWLMAPTGNDASFPAIAAAMAPHGVTATRRLLRPHEVLIVLSAGAGADRRAAFAALAALGAALPRGADGKPVEAELLSPATDVDIPATLAATPVTSCR